MATIKAGSIIKGPNWPEPVEIKFAEETGEYTHIVGATTVSGNHIDQLIPTSEFLNYCNRRNTILLFRRCVEGLSFPGGCPIPVCFSI